MCSSNELGDDIKTFPSAAIPPEYIIVSNVYIFNRGCMLE